MQTPTPLFDAPRSRRAPRLTALLLLGLVAHLFFMATPLHAAMLGPRTDEPQRASLTEGTTATALAGAAHHGGDCTVEWSPSDQPYSQSVWLMAGPRAGAAPLVGLPAAHPLPRAIGPPQGGDGQALLQVFRL